MSATILAFPRPSPTPVFSSLAADSLAAGDRPQSSVLAKERAEFLASGDHLPHFTAAWCAQHLPLIDAAMDLLSVDDAEFARRCALMRDADGRAMLDELAGQLQRLGAHIADVADALGLTAERIRHNEASSRQGAHTFETPHT